MSTQAEAKTDIPYEIFISVKALIEAKGWEHYKAEFETRLNSLTDEMHDLNTPADRAEVMRQARGRIMAEFRPETIAANLIEKAGGKMPKNHHSQQ